MTCTLMARGFELEKIEQEEGHIPMGKRTVTVGADRGFNVDNFETVRVHLLYTEVVEEGESLVKAGRKLAAVLPGEIEDIFKKFCKENNLKRKLPTMKK